MLPFDRGVVGELKVTIEDVKKTVGFGRYWPRQAHGLTTGAWTYDGLWMPPNGIRSARSYPWGDKGRSNLVLGFDHQPWTTTQADILKLPSAEEREWARTHTPIGASDRKGALKLDKSPYNALTGYRKESIRADERLEVPGRRENALRSAADDVSDYLDAVLNTKPDPRAFISTPVSEVREHFSDPALASSRGRTPLSQARYLHDVGVFKSTGSIGPPGW